MAENYLYFIFCWLSKALFIFYKVEQYILNLFLCLLGEK